MIKITLEVDTTKPKGEEIVYTREIKDSSLIENALAVRELMDMIDELLSIDYENTTISFDKGGPP